MIIRLNSEANLVKATEVKLIKTSDYQDTLTFKLPLDEQIFVDEIIRVRTKVMKQDYRVKEIITKDRFKDVYCEHKFFDCKNIIIPFIDEAHRAGESYNDFSRYNSLQSIVAHLNRIMRTKGDTEFKFSTDIDKSGVVECDDTPLFDLIFGEKGILKTFNVELVYDNYKVKFVEKRPSKNTEILFHENKNVSELQETVDFKGIITKLHVTCKYTPDKTEEGKAERERLRAEKRRELFNKSQEKIKAREARQAQERALRRQKQEEAYQASRTAPKKTREQIHEEHLQKQRDTENRILANNAARRQAREQKFNEREQQRVSRAQDKDDLIFRTVFISPLVNRYARPYEASLNFQSSEINSEAALIAWCNANLFTDEDTRDVPLRNFSFKPVEDDYNVDINDRAMVNFTSIGTTKIVHCCKIEYDALHDKYLNIEFGVLNKSAIRETIGNLNSKISETNSNISRAYDILDKNFDDYVQKELEAYSELFNIEKGEIEDTINQGFEDAKIEAEKVYGNINTDIENKLAPIREEVRTTVEAYNQQFITTRETLDRNKAEADRQIRELNKNKVETEKQFRELNQRVTGMQDISSNSTVVELKKLVNEAKETGKNINQKVTELEGNVTREFSSVKAKNENDLKVIRGEIKTGVDGLTSKINSLEQYKNQDGSRTESLKQWVQRDTASQLSRERTEITRIVDAKGYVKNAEFSNKFNENAQGINRKIEALETYKNQDGTRISSLKQWTQENTASQLSTARRGIENWVDGKGYATTTIVENKVQETANSISREIRNIRESIPTSVGGRNYIVDSDKLTNINSGGTNWEKTVENGTLVFTKVRATESTGIWTQIMPFLKDNFQNEVLTWSLDVKASKNISFNNVGQETNGFKGRVDLTTNWQRISHTFTNRYTQHYAFVFYQMLGTCSPGDKVYVRLPKLEKGNVATDWTPAPEDNNAFVKNTEFSNKFNENAQGINRQLTALEQYKNQEGVRTNLLKQWTQENTANQLTAARRSIESWVDNKGYATTSVVNNKVQETADSFSREISNVRNSIPTSVGGRNYVPNSGEPLQKEGHSWGGDWLVTTHAYYYNSNKKIMCLPNSTNTEKFIRSPRFKLKRNTDYVISFKGFASSNVSSMDLHVLGRRKNETSDFTIFTTPSPIINARKLSIHGLEIVKNIRFNSKEMDEAFLRFDNNGSTNNHSAALFIAEVKLEEGTISTDWTPAPEDSQQNINELNSWKQTTTQTLNTVSSNLNDTVRHSQLQITADSINFGSNKVFNGRNLASMLSVSPDSIKAITDRLIISPANENLVLPEFRDRAKSNSRDTWLTPKINVDGISIGDEYIFKGGIYPEIGTTTPHNINFILEYKSRQYGTKWITSRIISANGYSNERNYTLRVNVGITDIEYIRLGIQQETFQNYKALDIYNAQIYKKKSAELIVDGSIEGRQIKAETLETGHLKAGSVTANIVAADAIQSKHLKVDDAMLDKLVTNKAFVTKLWAQDAFIKTLQATKIKSTQIDTETLRGVTIEGAKFLVGRTGILDTSNSVLRFSTPFEWGGTSGIGMQLRGSEGGAFNQGLNIYRVNDVRYPDTPLYTPDEVALTVFGEIRGAFKLNTAPGSGALKTRMGVAVMTNVSYNNPTYADGYAGGLYSVRSIYLKSGGGPTQIWVNDGTGSNSTYGVNVANMESDIKLKENISISNHSGIEVIEKFTFHSFDWKEDKFGYRKPHTRIGLIAQEVQEVQEDLVYENPNALALDEFRLLNIALKAIQELSTQNKELQNRISKLEGEING